MKLKRLKDRIASVLLIDEVIDYDIALYIGNRRHSIRDEVTIRPLSREIAFHIKKEKVAK
jgi:hypothetical protein